jgi:hypothetical protein
MEDDEAQQVFQSMARFHIGDGRSTFFWKDSWIHGRSAESIAPEVAAMVPTRRKNVTKVAEGLLNNSWISDVQGDMSLEGWIQCIQLWEEIDSVARDADVPDRITWKGSASGEYTAKETYGMLCQGSITWSMAKQVWRSHAPLKCKIFGWLALRRRLWTSDRRARHGLQKNPDSCATCLQEEDNVDHILAQCPYAKMVWFRCLRRLGLHLQEPQEHTDLERWWEEARKRVRKEDRRWFDTFVLLKTWTLWKQRNARVFGNLQRQLSTKQIVDRVFEELRLWRSARVGERRLVPRE